MPAEPMGEAWFMGGERKMYRGLMQADPQTWSWEEMKEAVGELTSGPICFGHSDEWSKWFDCLLPRALQRIELGNYTCYDGLVSATFVHCPDPTLPGRPEEFRRDLLDTLGLHLMSHRLWNGDRVAQSWPFETLGDYAGGWQLNAQGPLSAGCCLVLRYLEPELFGEWIASVLAIDDPTWRGAFVIWLAGAAPLVFDQLPPEQLKSGFPADITWNEHWLFKQGVPAVEPDSDPAVFPFVADIQITAFVDALRKHLDLTTLVQWQDDLKTLETPQRNLQTALVQHESAAMIVAERYGLD